MSFRKFLLLPFALLFSLNQTTVLATPIPKLDLSTLTDQATLIVVGRVGRIVKQERTTLNSNGTDVVAHRMLATFDVQRVLKGQLNGTAMSFEFIVPETPIGYGQVLASQFDMFFLKETPQGGYIVANPYYPFLNALPNNPPAQNTDLDRVIAELIAVLLTPNESNEDRRRALYALDSAYTKTATRALRRAQRDPDTMLRLEASATLLRRDDIPTLEMVETILLHPPQNVDDYLVKNLAYGIRHGIKDSKAIPTLTRLLQASDVDIRLGAAGALRHTQSKDAISSLALALEDNDRQVRYEAVMGLAEITHQYSWGPSTDLFNREEERFLAHWREWAKSRQ